MRDWNDLALKRVGIPLAGMRSLLDADAAELITRLRANRETLARERERHRRADRAIAVVEESLRHTLWRDLRSCCV